MVYIRKEEETEAINCLVTLQGKQKIHSLLLASAQEACNTILIRIGPCFGLKSPYPLPHMTSL